MNNPKLMDLFKTLHKYSADKKTNSLNNNSLLNSVLTQSVDTNFANKMSNPYLIEQSNEKALGQRRLRQQYMQDSICRAAHRYI